MNKKSTGAFLLSTLFALALTSCNGDKPQDTPQIPNPPAGDTEKPGPSVQESTDRYESFVESDYETRKEILGTLESYAMENFLTGIPLYDNGGYVKYSSRVKIPTKVVSTPVGDKHEYQGVQYATPIHESILNYGFGIISDGKLEGKLSGVSDAYGDYYRTFESQNPNCMNVDDDKGSVVNSLSGHIKSSFFSQKLNAEKDGYVLYPSTATDVNMVEGQPRPLPVGKDGNLVENPKLDKTYNRFRVYVRTGKDGYKYNVLPGSKYAAKFDNSPVKVEDYLTELKHKHNQSNALKRGAEGLEGAQAIKGLANYYNSTKDGFDAEAWSKVGVKTGSDAKGEYVEYEFVTPCLPYYAQYYFNASPLPESFLTEIGGYKNFGKPNSKTGATIVDTTLSCGPFVVETWNNQEFAFKKADQVSTDVLGGPDRYQVKGVHYAINEAVDKDPEAAWKEFTANKYDSVGIPMTKIKEEKTTANTQIGRGDATFKLNVNALDQATWDKLFGVNGTVSAQPDTSKHYKVKPAMSNKNFLMGITHSINRQQFADNRGTVPSLNYFSDVYLTNPETNESYNATKQHQDNLTKVYGASVESFGYDEDMAASYFKKAAEELVAQGKYNKGDKIEIEIFWMHDYQIERDGTEIVKYIKDCWNLAQTGLTLEIKQKSGAQWMDVYDAMMTGSYDIGFGSISGNPFNPINFLEVLKADNSSGFTLNWGTDTNTPDIEYKGKKYSFDSLWRAADMGCVMTEDGKEIKDLHTATLTKENSVVKNSDGSVTVTMDITEYNQENVASTKFTGIDLVWLDAPEELIEKGENFYELSYKELDRVKNQVSITISKDIVEKCQGKVGLRVHFDFAVTAKGFESSPSDSVSTVTFNMPK